MANSLDEMNDPILEGGRDVNVINKKVAVPKSTGAVILEIFLWILLIIPGVIFEIKKAKTASRDDRKSKRNGQRGDAL